jgi:hypothetical protein
MLGANSTEHKREKDDPKNSQEHKRKEKNKGPIRTNKQ